MPGFPLLHRIRRGDWVDHFITVAQILVAAVALLGIAGCLTLNPFLLLTFIFAQPLVAIGIILFVIAGFFFDRAMLYEDFDPGEVIYAEGSPARSFYLIKSGIVEALIKRPDGKLEPVATFEAGNYVGVAAFAPNMPRQFTARAVTPVKIIRMRTRDFVAFFEEIPELREQVSIVQKKIQEAIEKLRSQFAAKTRTRPVE